MGVKGLWKLIASAGVPVPLETLEHKILAVDVSIWLHQAVRGFRGPGGAAVANAHLLTLFHRICKLLFYRIRPVFVFDGGVPHLKKQTMASRRLKREVATSKAQQVRKRLLDNLLKSQAVRRALGRTGPGPSLAHVPRPQKREKDMFELPPLPKTKETEAITSIMSDDSEDEEKMRVRNMKLPNLHQFELESEEFKALPIETQHEILTELQDTRKQNSWHYINEMPQESEDFATFQMNRLLKRSKFQATLDSTREEIRKRNIAQMEEEMFGELDQHVSMSQQIISEDAAHSLLVKKVQPKEEEVKDTVKEKEDKGKSPMKKKKKTFGKDFLTELAKQGIVRASNSESDSDLDDPDYPSDFDCESDASGQNAGKRTDLEEEGFLQVVSTLMENSGLTQDEILALIKQENTAGSPLKTHPESNGPTTSQKAPGVVFNPDADSSDDDDGDFIEVVEPQPLPHPGDTQVKDPNSQVEANNIVKLLNRKTDSLWMKIVQQKLDDMVHVKTLKASPGKAVYDSRRVSDTTVTQKKNSDSENLKAVKISLDFEVKPLKIEDDIFSDIFTDINCRMLGGRSQNTEKNVTVGSVKKHTSEDTGKITSKKEVDRSVPGSDSKTSKPVSNSDISDRKEGAEAFKTQNPGIERNITSLSDINMKPQPVEQKKYTKPPESHGKGNKSEVPVPSELKNINVDEALQSKLNELVRLEIEKLVKSSPKVNKPEATQSHTTENYEDDVGIMSSSDDSDTEESLAPTETADSLEKTEPQKLRVTSTLPDVAQMTGLGSKTYEDDFIEVKDDNENRTNTKTNIHAISPSVSGSETDDDDFVEVEDAADDDGNKNSATGLVNKVQDKKDSNYTQLVKQKLHQVNTVEVGKIKEGAPDDESRTKDSDTENHKELSTGKEEEETEQGAMRNDAKSPTKDVDEVERPVNYTDDELKQLEGELAAEQQTLVAEAQRTDRVASNLNDQMYGEAQHLLQLFGIPYLVAPMEAEAQCAFLDMVKLTAGTITDDSDIFLFGGSGVYKNFFNQLKHVEFFKIDNIKANFGLDRSKLITLALLTGSDYTEGVESVGAVAAMEILAEFPGEGIDCLRNMKKWWDVAHRNVAPTYSSKVKQKLARLMIPESFPNLGVYDAYLEPEVDESREKFTWAVPNVEALRTFTTEKFGWNLAKTDEILVPVMKKLGVKTSQMRIDSFFTNIKLVKEDKIPSNRIKKAIARAKGEGPPKSDQELAKKRKKPVTDGLPKKKAKSDGGGEAGSSTVSLSSEGNSDGTAVEEKTDKPERPGSSKPSKTLLIDPSESKSSVAQPKRATKRKSKESGAVDTHQPSRTDAAAAAEDAPPPRMLTKEIMYKALLEKETISQREVDQKKMAEKKLAAAQVLKKKLEKGKSRKR